MSNAIRIFTAFEKNGSLALDAIRKRAFTPNVKKELRVWGINDACEMVGRSRKTISDLEKENKIPTPKNDPNTNRKRYTLEHINMLRDYFGTRPKRPENSEAAIIAVTNFKGGVWKTTTSYHAAQYFALKGYRVLLVDADSQASSTQCFGYIPDNDIGENETLLPYLIGESKNFKSSIRQTYWHGLDLIPANLALYNAEFILPVQNATKRSNGENFLFYEILKNGINSIKNDYDIIFIDCPPSMGMISINAIYAANSLLIPIPPSMLDFTSTVQFFGMLKDVVTRLSDINYNFVRLLITKHENSDNAKELVDIIRELFGNYVHLAVCPNSEAVKKAGTQLLSIYEIEKYVGSQKTLDRIKDAMDRVYTELEDLIITTWRAKSSILPSLNEALLSHE